MMQSSHTSYFKITTHMKRLFLLFSVFFLFTAFITVQAQTTSSGSTEAAMGFARAVTISGESVVIGEPANPHQPGMVYIFNRSGDEWGQEHQLSASDGEIGDGFGVSLNADGDRILIGAPEKNDERGAAYIFERAEDGTWNESARIALSDTSRGGFGSSVALHGDLAFIGAPEESEEAGAVYVFERTNSDSWSQKARLANPDTSKGFSFGSALSADESRLIVGAPKNKAGAVHIYKSDGGDWKKEATLTTNQVADNSAFASTMAMRDNQVLVGAPNHSAGSGAVFVFERNTEKGKWEMSGRLLAFDGEPRYGFGSSLAFVENDVWIGAPGADEQKGTIYQFEQEKNANEWVGVTKMAGPDREQGDRFGGTIAVNDDDDIAVAGLVGADYGAGTASILTLNDETDSWEVQSTVISEGSSVLKPITEKVECSDGSASHFGCGNVDLLSFLPTSEIGGDRGVRLNDIWGWTDPKTGKEYALVGRMDGTSFVDVSNPSNPVYVANLPKPDSVQASVWRDIKVYDNHAFVVADNANDHGIQVVDLTNLRDFEGTPLILKEVAHYDRVHSVHNIVINKDTGFAYAVGSSGGGQTCGGGLHMINIQDPTNPTFAGCFADPSTGRSGTGYTHDAQCVKYEGPDEQYQGHEICLGANETAISIGDVTDKDKPRAVSTVSYPDYGYVHQGWLTEDQRYFYQNDELDELTGKVDSTRTLVWDVSDLDDPQFVREYFFDNRASDHNLYIKGDFVYESNYVSGLQVLDISDPENPVKVGFFDTAPFGEDKAGFSGTWSNYPFFESDIVIMTSSQEGLFVLDKQETTTRAAGLN